MTTDRRTAAASLLALPWVASATTPPANASTAPGTASALFAVEFRTGPAWDAAKKPHEQLHFRDHSQNLRRLREAGHLVLGARYADKGLVVLAAASEAAARVLVDVDPAVQQRVFAYELHPFHVFYGGSVQPPPRAAG